MKKIPKITIIAIFILTYNILSNSAFAEENDVKITNDKLFSIEIGAGISKFEGHTTYQIGGNVSTAEGESFKMHFPLSELIFPLNVYMASLHANFELFSIFEIHASIQKNLTTDAGKMKDSDWGAVPFEYPLGSGDLYVDPNSLDIYSESDSDLDSSIFKMNLRFNFYKTRHSSFDIIYTGGAGYIYQIYEYECKLINQWSPSGHTNFNAEGDGRIGIKYEAVYHFPYIEFKLTGKLSIGIDIEGAIGYSPFVKATDIDNHVLRDPVLNSEGECDGSAYMFSLSASYYILENWSIGMGYEYTAINTKGTEDQYHENQYRQNIYFATIDKNMTSEQGYIYIDTRVIY